MSAWNRRDVLIAGAAGATAGALPAFAKSGSSLEALARAKGFHFGTALGGRGLADEKYRELVRSQCGVIVPENEQKMQFIQPRPGEFRFDRADAIVDFARQHELAVRGHCLLWHHPRWLPQWMHSHDFGARPATAAAQLITQHVATLSRHFTGIRSWDVVNEAVHNITGEMRETPLSKAMGSPDAVVEHAFRVARDLLPEAELVYNDYMGWENDNGPHRDGVLRLLERLRRNSVPVNALGIQAHIGAGNQDSNNNRAFDARDERAWRRFLEDVTGMGYGLLITEFDVHDAPLPADIRERDRTVAAFGRDFLDLTLSFPQVNAVLCWGLADSHTWLQGRNPRPDGLRKRPTPYDEKLRAKPLRDAIADAFRAAPMRRPSAIAGIPA